MILNGSLKFRKEIDFNEIPDNQLFYIDNSLLKINSFSKITENHINDSIDILQNFSKNIKNRLYCQFMYRDNDGKCYSYKFDTKNIKKEECEIAIIEKKTKSNKNTLTFDDKIDLFKEYVKTYNKTPEQNEIYKEFKIGKFYIDICSNKEKINLIEQILEENR